jgi:hypothetical protein
MYFDPLTNLFSFSLSSAQNFLKADSIFGGLELSSLLRVCRKRSRTVIQTKKSKNYNFFNKRSMTWTKGLVGLRYFVIYVEQNHFKAPLASFCVSCAPFCSFLTFVGHIFPLRPLTLCLICLMVNPALPGICVI